MVAADDDRRLDSPGPHELVEDEPHLRALAVPEPADARGQALELHALACQADPARERPVLRERLEHGVVGRVDVLGIAGERAQRNGPLPSQKSGRMYAGTKPGMSNAFATPAFCASARRLLP